MNRFPALLTAFLLVAGMARAAAITMAEVRDGESGRPVARAAVSVAGSDLIAVTDDSGRCLLLDRVGRGSRLVASRTGYFPDTVTFGSPARRDTVLVEFRLHPDLPRYVRGRVTDVGARQGQGDAAVQVVGTGIELRTDLDGMYAIPVFPHGTWTLRCYGEGYAAETARVTARGGETTEVDFALRDTTSVGRLQGDVSDGQTGARVAGAAVVLDGTGLATSSDSAGHYELARLPAGVYDLTVTCAGYERGVTRFRLVKGWDVTVDLAVWRTGAAPKRPQR